MTWETRFDVEPEPECGATTRVSVPVGRKHGGGGYRHRSITVRCVRPDGHSGDHMSSSRHTWPADGR